MLFIELLEFTLCLLKGLWSVACKTKITVLCDSVSSLWQHCSLQQTPCFVLTLQIPSDLLVYTSIAASIRLFAQYPYCSNHCCALFFYRELTFLIIVQSATRTYILKGNTGSKQKLLLPPTRHLSHLMQCGICVIQLVLTS